MKRFFPILLCLALLLVCCPNVLAAEPPNGWATVAVFDYTLDRYSAEQTVPVVTLRLNDATICDEVPGVVVNNRTLAPLRLLAEKMGAQVEWVPNAAQVVVRLGSDTILLTLGSDTAYVNGISHPLPDGVPATGVFYQNQGYTMVPLRFFSETFHCQVEWEQESYTASVFTPDYQRPLSEQLEVVEPPIEPENPLLAGLDTPISPEKFLICLDAGHGGKWSGAVHEEVMEKDLTIAMTHKLNDILRAMGYNTLLTREQDEDVELVERAVIANKANADIFVSIHCNAIDNGPDIQGLIAFYYPGSKEGENLAQSIQTSACQFSGAVDRGINSANYAVVRETYMPAVLVETGFMTCHEELLRLMDDTYQTDLVRGIAQGIVGYLNTKAANAQSKEAIPEEEPEEEDVILDIDTPDVQLPEDPSENLPKTQDPDSPDPDTETADTESPDSLDGEVLALENHPAEDTQDPRPPISETED